MRTRQTQVNSPNFNSRFCWNAYLKKWMDFRVNCILEVELSQCREKTLADNYRDKFTKARISSNAINIKADVLASWNEHERDVFIQRFIKVGKNFLQIADALPDKTVAQCIHYYYLTKHQICYKQLRKMAIDEECENRGTKSRGVKKGNKKALGYLRNAEQNTGIVIEEKTDKNVPSAEYDDEKCKKVFISDNSRVNIPGTSTTITIENSIEGMEVKRIMIENAKDTGDTGFSGKRPKETKRCTVLNEGGVKKHRVRRKLTEGDKRRKGKALKELCTAANLLANNVPTAGFGRYNASEKHEKSSRKNNDSPSCRKYYNNLPNTDTHVLTPQDQVVHRDAAVTKHSHAVTYKGKEPKGVSGTHQLQSKVAKVARHLVGGHSDTTSTLSDVLCFKKKEAKTKGITFNKAINKSFGKVIGEFRKPKDKKRKELFKKTPAQGHHALKRTIIISKEARIDKNNNLKSSRKVTKKVNTIQCCDKYFHKKGQNADNCCIASSSKPTKRKAENVTEDRPMSGYEERVNKTLKRKSHGTDVGMKSLKKQRLKMERAKAGQSLVSDQERLLTTEQTRAGSGTSNLKKAQANCKGKSYKRKGCTKQTATVERFFDVFGSLFDSARSDHAFTETKMDQSRKELKEQTSAHVHLQSNLSSCDSKHGKRPAKEKWPAKNKTSDSFIKNQGFCRQNKVDCRTSAKHGGKRPKYVKSANGKNVNRTKGTFDLATVFYEGTVSEKFNVKTGEEGCSYADDCRITCVKTKRTKQCELSTKPTRKKVLQVVDHLTKEARIECTNVKTTCLKGSDVGCDKTLANRNRVQSEFVLNEPTTSKDPRCFNGFTGSKKTNLNSEDTDCQITWIKENRRENQEKSFIDAIIEATKTAKSSFNGDGKVVNQVQIGAKHNTKGIKRKITSQRVDNKAFKKALIIDDRSNNRVSGGKRPVKEESLGYDCLNMAGELGVTPHESYTKCGKEDQRFGFVNIQAVTPGLCSFSYSWKNNGNEKYSEKRMF